MKEKIDTTISEDWLANTMVGLSEILRENNLGLLSIVADLNDKVFNENDHVNIAEN